MGLNTTSYSLIATYRQLPSTPLLVKSDYHGALSASFVRVNIHCDRLYENETVALVLFLI